MIGKKISHYRILEKIGGGGMGVVYLANDDLLERKVALKFLHEFFTSDDGTKNVFMHEARTMATLNHPNIVTIYEIGNFEGKSYLVIEYVDGESLENVIKNKNLSLDQTLDIAIQLCEGLNEAHRKGIIHRDIKPGNILIDKRDRVKIADFGVAKLKEATHLSRRSAIKGTLQYLSPEQIQSMDIDQRSDIFSFGVVFYEMITGQLPFKGDHEAAIMYSIVYESPAPVDQYKIGIPPGIKFILDKALEKNPEKRYLSVGQVLTDLIKEKEKLTKNKPHISFPSPADEIPEIRKLAAIMFIDIVGYSRMMSRDEIKTLKLLRDFDQSVSPIVFAHGGDIIKKMGDGLFCEFNSALEAVDSALKIQETLNFYNISHSKDFQLNVRIGIHLGDVVKKNNDLFGDGVNIAARIETKTPPGGICVSEAVYSAVSSHPNIEIISLGRKKLKNMSRRQKLYQIKPKIGLRKESIPDTIPESFSPDSTTLSLKSKSLLTSLQKSIGLKGMTLVVIFVTLTLIFFGMYRLFFSTKIEPISSSLNTSIQSTASAQANIFKENIFKITRTSDILTYLQTSQQQGKLNFGRQSSFKELENKYVLVLDEQSINAVLLFKDGKFINLNDLSEIDDLGILYKGKRTIWIELFE